MRGDLDRLRQGPWDLLVVGGGIYGAWIAYDAALRGLKTVLVERTDWAAATSSASSKLIHGGLRYLEHYEFRLVRKSLDERRRLARLGPHRVRPLRFGLPVRRGARVGRLQLKAGLWLYDRLAGAQQPVYRHRSLSKQNWIGRYPFLDDRGLTGGFTYGDAQTDDARMTLEIVDGAAKAGALTLNGVEAVAWLRQGKRVHGARLKTLDSGKEFDVEAGAVADCAGPWSGLLNPGEGPAYRLAKGAHLLMPALPTADAFLLNSDDDGRIVFLIPWYGRTLLGTTDTDYDGDPAAVRCTSEDEAYLLERANRYLRSPGWSRDDIFGRYAGLRVLPAGDEDHPSEVSREWILSQPLDGLLTAVGGKYTSARADAAVAVDAALEICGKPPTACPTEDRRFPWAPDRPLDEWVLYVENAGTRAGFDPETARGIATRYGSRAPEVLAREGTERIVDSLPYCWAELDHCAAVEGVRSLNDLLRRRLPLVLLHPVDRSLAELCAERAGKLLDWDPARQAQEVDRLLERHRPGDAQSGAPTRGTPE